jgi:hypothetical protein
MEKGKKWSKGWKYLGIGLLVLVIPGSSLLLPALLAKKILENKENDQILGI